MVQATIEFSAGVDTDSWTGWAPTNSCRFSSEAWSKAAWKLISGEAGFLKPLLHTQGESDHGV